ncbi:hypothetical protein LEMLEM_LOCUS3747, partial [Lemmus lemmus]
LPVGQYLLQLQPFPSFCRSKSSLSNPLPALPGQSKVSYGSVSWKKLHPKKTKQRLERWCSRSRCLSPTLTT